MKYVMALMMSLVLIAPVTARPDVEGYADYSAEAVSSYYVNREEDKYGLLGHLKIRGEKWLSESLRGQFGLRVTGDNMGMAGGLDEWGNERRRPVIRLRDAYVESATGSAEFGIGVRQWNSSVIEDVSGPLNHHSMDLLDPIDDLEEQGIGEPSVWLRAFGETVSIQGSVFLFTPSKLPLEEDHLWRLRVLEGVGIADMEYPSNPFQFGLRADLAAWGADVSLDYFHGHSPVPGFEVTGPASVRPGYFEMDSYGIGLVAEFRGFVLRAEGAYIDQSEGQDDVFRYAAGIDSVVSRSGFETKFGIQYVGEDVANKGSAPLQEWDFRSVFRNSVMAKAELDTGTWFLGVRGVYNIDKEDSLVKARVSRTWSGKRFDVEAGLEYHWLDGPDRTFFGEYGDNDRILAVVKIGL